MNDRNANLQNKYLRKKVPMINSFIYFIISFIQFMRHTRVVDECKYNAYNPKFETNKCIEMREYKRCVMVIRERSVAVSLAVLCELRIHSPI